MSESFTHRSVIVATFPRPETWRWMKETVIGCLTCQSNGLMGGPWPMKAAMDSRTSAVSLKVWLRETTFGLALCFWLHWVAANKTKKNGLSITFFLKVIEIVLKGGNVVSEVFSISPNYIMYKDKKIYYFKSNFLLYAIHEKSMSKSLT